MILYIFCIYFLIFCKLVIKCDYALRIFFVPLFQYVLTVKKQHHRKYNITYEKGGIKYMKNILKYITIFISGGIIYMCLEIFWRGWTHWTMGVLGGLCTVLIGLINEILPDDTPLLVQAPLASIIITILEYYTGYILNIKLGLNIWDYSQLPFNVDGQVCLYASLLWMVLGLIAVILDDAVRSLFGEEYVKHHLI